MKVEEEYVNHSITYYICERCGYRWQNSNLYISRCPTHGDFCTHCVKKPRFPFVICPDCKIGEDTIVSYQYQKNNPPKGPNYLIENLLLPDPFIVIKHDTTGFWIGSEEVSNENNS